MRLAGRVRRDLEAIALLHELRQRSEFKPHVISGSDDDIVSKVIYQWAGVIQYGYGRWVAILIDSLNSELKGKYIIFIRCSSRDCGGRSHSIRDSNKGRGFRAYHFASHYHKAWNSVFCSMITADNICGNAVIQWIISNKPYFGSLNAA